jgi:peptide/nickel transport system permease protein
MAKEIAADMNPPSPPSTPPDSYAGLMAPPKVNEVRRFLRVFLGRPLVIFGMVIFVIMILVAILAPFIAPYPPNDPDLTNTLAQPSMTHWMGTDALGRDVLSRVIYGTRISLLIGLSVVIISSIIGIILGLLAGYYGGWTYILIMRVMDSLMAFPMTILVLVIAALLGGGIRNVIIALSVGMLPGYVRVMCGMVLSAKENDWVMAERSIGASNSRIIFQHIFHNCLSPFIVIMTMQLGGVILAEAGLSFLGVGITPPTAAWGSMVNDGRQYLLTNPILSVGPGIVLMLVVFAFNMLGDGIRDAIDPRLRGTL